MSDRQATLGDVQQPEDWIDVYSHGSPEEGYLIAIPENHLQEELSPVTKYGYQSQVQAILEAVKYGSNHLENAFRVYNADEAAVGCAAPGGNKPSTCTELFREIWEYTREYPSQIRFELTALSRQEILAL